MLITCDNKGCYKTTNALYDLESKNVICQECGNAVTNVSETMKRALSSFGQVVRTEQRKGFLMACKTCNANRQIVLNQHGDTICKQCHSPISVQRAFLSAMENTGALERVHVEENTNESQVEETPVPQARKVTRTKKSSPAKSTSKKTKKPTGSKTKK